MSDWNSDHRLSRKPKRVQQELLLALARPAEDDPESNFRGLVAEAKRRTAFSKDFDFAEDSWFVESAGKALHFRRLSTNGSKSAEKLEPLAEDFSAFAKAILLLRESRSHLSFSWHHMTLTVLRVLYNACEDVDHHPCMLESYHFHRALLLIKQGPQSSQYGYGKRLDLISRIVNEVKITERPINFRSDIQAPTDATNIVDSIGKTELSGSRLQTQSDESPKSFADGRKVVERNLRGELISDDAWDALYAVSRLVKNGSRDGDRICMAVTELLAVGGWRIGEVLNMNYDYLCLDGPDVKTSKPIPLDEFPRDLWIHYELSKEKAYHAKRIPYAAIPIVLDALAEIRRISEPARQAARFIHGNPGLAPRPDAWKDLPSDTMLQLGSVADTLGVSPKNVRKWLQDKGAPICDAGLSASVMLGEIDRINLQTQSKMLPSEHLQLHQLLCIMPLFTCWLGRNPKYHIVERLKKHHLEQFLGGRNDFAASRRKNMTREASPMKIDGLDSDRSADGERLAGVPSVFERLKPRHADGEVMTDGGRPVRILTHQFRHHLSTAMIKGGAGYLAMNGWLGRKRIDANRQYIHLNSDEMRLLMRTKLREGAFQGYLAEAVSTSPEEDREGFNKAIASAIVVTDIGVCLHDWSILPCQNHGACGGCSYNFLFKGDAEQRREAVQQLTSHNRLLSTAELDAGVQGLASNHTRHHRKMIRALEKIVATHDDPRIPDGTLVQIVSAAAAGHASREEPVS
jgi:hypothetical protein